MLLPTLNKRENRTKIECIWNEPVDQKPREWNLDQIWMKIYQTHPTICTLSPKKWSDKIDLYFEFNESNVSE